MSDIYVEVLHDFKYNTEAGNEVQIKSGEELMLVKKSSENWWQVIRNTGEDPFYAPSNYLNIIGLHCNDLEIVDINSNFTGNNQMIDSKAPEKPKLISDINNKTLIRTHLKDVDVLSNPAKDGLVFRNPLCSDEFHDDNNESEKSFSSINEVDTDSQFYIHSSTAERSDQDSDVHIYANIPIAFGKTPPIPKTDEKPLRKLSNDWLEYVDDGTARKYYFHTASGKVTWKPPRRGENFQSTPLNSEPNSPKFGNSSIVPEPPPKQLKPKLKKLAHGSNESLESQSSSCMFTILPPGWSQESDSSTGALYYHNDLSNKKWFSSVDENGRTYFYDEDSSESVWELPDLSDSTEIEESKKADESLCQLPEVSFDIVAPAKISCDSSPKLRKKAPRLPVPRQFKTRSLVVPECVNLGSGEDNKGYLPPSFGEGYWPSVQDGHFSITHKGTLNKTKLVEGGRRIRKNWTSSFVVLTDVFLLFYKDIRSAHLGSPGIKPELLIDLNGALVEWCPDKSSRKNVFQISTVLGQQLLLQDDNAQTTKEWFDTIQAAIMKLPSSLEQISHNQDENMKKDVKLARSKSTKYYPSSKSCGENDIGIPAEKKRKIRDKLRQFFVRRPTLESLREKGILVDELVFGCNLESLCSRENSKVPKFVINCIEAIEKRELTADGLYRASGNLSQVQKIRLQVNQDDYSCIAAEEDVHVLTGALKMFFRELKEPLFPFNMFDKFLHAIALPDAVSKLESLKELVKQMPEPNYETLKRLLEHLLRVTKYHKQNRMQIQNLAIVFGPTLLCSEHSSSNIAVDMMHQNRIVEFLLLEFESIFNDNYDI